MPETPSTPFDYILTGGTLIDGTQAPRRQADVGVRGDRVAAIGDLSGAQAHRRIDVSGKIVAPGFIDSHTHDDNYLLARPDMTAKVSQGVTTVITGNCGISLAPLAHASPPPPLDLLDEGGSYHFTDFGHYLDALRQAPPAVNAACMVGHSTLRAAVMPALDRAATADEIDAMRELAEQAMAAGAIGISTGTFYPPAANATTEELIEVCRPLTAHHGIYATHMRDEGDHIVDALQETFRIGRELNVPVVISHHKVMGRNNFGRSGETLAIIEDAMARQPIAIDAYPYIAGSSMLKKDRTMLAGKTVLTWCKPFPELAGRDLDDIAAERGKAKYDVVDELQPAGAIYFMMDEADVQRILAFDSTMIGSDGLPHDERPHPRLWGTFPRVLGHYARDVGLFSLETAVWKMTGLTAAKFGLADRGRIEPGAYADLVVFDAQAIVDAATFEKPTERAQGIEAVFVNGTPVWIDQAHSGARPGRVLERRAA
ncbi:N-acyl-D-amino-acid deacylase [Bordetella ansorpii]|uniref:N-acyl-D-amino-acid deacylase n=1 Tax=Bordetella ansorpii TaxID=288768 RepID=A0A157SKT6_9BORD|nr:D-aminoacylase [Bordetella ansorpii]SAI71037.1 N-acyl-D-amino-acid deacylase [Bordetella ansorpii]